MGAVLEIAQAVVIGNVVEVTDYSTLVGRWSQECSGHEPMNEVPLKASIATQVDAHMACPTARTLS
ncbi:MAG: hypothetical protein ACTH2U_11085 [Brevibacterium sp.]